jgi:FixJ family two-component response regulator
VKRNAGEESFVVIRSARILIAAPDEAFRRSLVFTLESDGFTVNPHAQATEAFASPQARHAACAVIDDDAVSDWTLASRQFGHFGRPVILLVGFLQPVRMPLPAYSVMKPFLGEPLVEAIRDAIAGKH